MKQTERKAQKELRKEYLEEIAKIYGNDKKMMIYYQALVSRRNIYKLRNGSLLLCESPLIQTKFRIGFNTEGRGITYDEAERLSVAIKSDERYFMNQNMNDRAYSIGLKNLDDDSLVMFLIRQYRQYPREDVVNICNCVFFDASNLPKEDGVYMMKATEEDRELYRSILNKEKSLHKAKLENHIKVHGLSKIKVDVYWTGE